MALLCNAVPLVAQAGPLRQILRQRLGVTTQDSSATKPGPMNGHDSGGAVRYTIAGLDVAVWKPLPVPAGTPAPTVIFSHGFHGRNTQSTFLTSALATHGYLVIAPNHKDALGAGGGLSRPEIGFRNASAWNEKQFKNRGDDIARLIDALHKDPQWSSRIDWSRVALAGHSLGGYTVLALGGAWPTWKLPGIKAILALSPYCEPFVEKGSLGGIGIPVMYQGGTRDLGVTPFVKRTNGAFSKTSTPSYFVEFDKVGHFGWTSLNKNQTQLDLINYYAIAFLDKYLKDDFQAKPEAKLAGVTDLEVK